jgi:hypothetical protein
VAVDVDKLQAVVTRLGPLSSTVSGDLIKAQDWNALVLALVDVARAVLAEAPATVPPHTHLGQVKAEWLDPRLATAIERGPLGEPDAAARLGGVERSAGALGGRLDGLGAELGQLRLRLNEVSSRDLERQAQVSSLGLRVSGIGDAREDVTAVRATLASVQDSLGRALAVAQQLVVDGHPVDLGAMTQRLTGLETFRDGLRAADGNLLDAARINDELRQATASLVTAAQLDAALKSHAGALSPDQLSGITNQVSASLRAETDLRLSQLTDSLRAETADKLSGIDGTVSRAIADALPSFSDAALAQVRPELAATVAAVTSDLHALVEKRVIETSAALNATVDAQLAAAQRASSDAIAAEVGKQVAAGLEPLQRSMADVAAKNAALGAALDKQTGTLSTLGQRIESVAATEASARDRLEKTLRAEIDARDTRNVALLDARTAALDTALRARIDESATSLRTEITRRRPP